MLTGQIYKIHSDFYYVKSEDGTYECKLRENIKKQKQNITTGDIVDIEDGFINYIHKRKNYIKRPNVANLDLLLVVSSIKEPDLDLVQLNRYLIFAKYHKIETALCFSKDDLNFESNIYEEITKIYEPLGYKIFFTSSKNKEGILELKEYLKGKTVVLCGNSGVGKSSLINSFFQSVDLRVQSVSDKTKRGIHTTRHSEIIELDGLKIVDTPGFSQIKFDFILPQELSDLFDEIKVYRSECKYKNCTHTQEVGCHVLKNITNIAKSRYESYVKFLSEAKEFKEKIKTQSIKTETLHKDHLDKIYTKISIKKRAKSRKTEKQDITAGNFDIY